MSYQAAAVGKRAGGSSGRPGGPGADGFSSELFGSASVGQASSGELDPSLMLDKQRMRIAALR